MFTGRFVAKEIVDDNESHRMITEEMKKLSEKPQKSATKQEKEKKEQLILNFEEGNDKKLKQVELI